MTLYEPPMSGDDWEAVPCLQVLMSEIRDCADDGLLPGIVSAGVPASREHQLASPISRHNKYAVAGKAKLQVAAHDIGGTASSFSRIADFHQFKYRAHDARLYPYAFCQWGDGYGLEWFTGDREWTGRDQGHCHIDMGMKTASVVSPGGWWIDALNSTDVWGLREFLTGETYTGKHGEDDDMALTAEEHRWLETVYNRIMAVTGDSGAQWMVKQVDGQWTRSGVQVAGAKKIELLDSLDGQTLRNEIIAGNERLDDVRDAVNLIKVKVGA